MAGAPVSGPSFEPGQDRPEDRLRRAGYVFSGDVQIHPDTVLEKPIRLVGGLHNTRPARFGAFTYSWSAITGGVTSIGRYCSIARDVKFAVGEHPLTLLSTSPFAFDSGPGGEWEEHRASRGVALRRPTVGASALTRDISIGNDVWIGEGAYIKGGVSLGDGCVVGTGAIVTKDVPPYAIVGGNPAKIIRYRFDEVVVGQLLRLRWWDYDFCEFEGVDLSDVRAAIDAIMALRESGRINTLDRSVVPFSQVLKTFL